MVNVLAAKQMGDRKMTDKLLPCETPLIYNSLFF